MRLGRAVPPRNPAASATGGAAASSSVGSSAASDTAAPFDAATTASLQKALDDTRAAGAFPGAIAGVWFPQGSWVGTTGTKGEGSAEAPAPTDHTRIGSLTKTMTATVLLQLVHEGALSLDDPIGKYVPGVPNDTATLRQVADMTSGIPTYTVNEDFTAQLFANPEKVWTPEELVAFVRDTAPDFAPGTSWNYSNTNYVLLGMAIEQVTGKPIAQVFSDRLFTQLGMAQTVFPAGDPAIADPHLDGLTDQGQPAGQTTDATNWSPSEAFTAGEVVSTFDDLQLWAHALFTGQDVLDPASQQLRRDSVVFNQGPLTATSGYGIGIVDRDGWWGHDGEIPGYTSSVQHNYETDTTIITVVNSDIGIPAEPKPLAAAPAVSAALNAALGGS